MFLVSSLYGHRIATTHYHITTVYHHITIDACSQVIKQWLWEQPGNETGLLPPVPTSCMVNAEGRPTYVVHIWSVAYVSGHILE